jgi:hypothetical protein
MFGFRVSSGLRAAILEACLACLGAETMSAQTSPSILADRVVRDVWPLLLNLSPVRRS